MEEKNNTPNKLDFISKFRAQYQVPKNVPNEMVEFFPSFEHAWAGWCMACQSQPTQSVGLTDEQISKMWSDAGVEALRQCGGQIGGVDAAYNLRPLIFARSILARHTATSANSATSGEAVIQNVTKKFHDRMMHTPLLPQDFGITDPVMVERAKNYALALAAYPAAAPDSAQQGEDWTDEQIAAYDRAMCETAQQGEDEPPLPEPAVDRHPMGATQDYYTAYQMRQYGDARAAYAVAHMMRKLGDGVSIDTPEFRKLDAAYARAFFEWEDSPSEKTGWNLGNARRDLIAHINAKLAQARAAGAERAVPSISADEMAAFNRFCECCEDFDSGGYDVDKAMMKRLACIGLVRACGFGRYETTAFGDAIRYGAERAAPGLSDVSAAVNRFLGWRLPASFAPDCGISFKPLGHPNGWPIGTNLFTADEAKTMFEYCLAAAPSPAAAKEGAAALARKDGAE